MNPTDGAIQPTETHRSNAIRSATNDDIDGVHGWLQREKALGIPGNFLCNWNVILDHHSEGQVLVYVDPNTHDPIAFLAGGLTKDGILQVQHTSQRRGIGTALVGQAIEACVAKGRSIVVIECAPLTSIPFWQKMGFTMVEDESTFDSAFAYRILPKQHELPAEGRPIDVMVRFFSEQRLYGGDALPLSSHSPAARQMPDGTVHLSEQVAFAKCSYPRDVVVEFLVAGKRVFLDKAKRDGASDLGMAEDREGFYLDKIKLGIDQSI